MEAIRGRGWTVARPEKKTPGDFTGLVQPTAALRLRSNNRVIVTPSFYDFPEQIGNKKAAATGHANTHGTVARCLPDDDANGARDANSQKNRDNF